MRLGIALRAFWSALTDRQMASQIEALLAGQEVAPGRDAIAGPSEADKASSSAGSATAAAKGPAAGRPSASSAAAASAAAAAAAKSARDPSVTLLAALQREARLIDLVREDLAKYSDAQVGAAARPCLQQCAGVLDRWFAIEPLVEASEGDAVDVPADASPIRYQWVGESSAATGKLVHHGWQATKVELPRWTGDDADANVVAPAQVQSS